MSLLICSDDNHLTTGDGGHGNESNPVLTGAFYAGISQGIWYRDLVRTGAWNTALAGRVLLSALRRCGTLLVRDEVRKVFQCAACRHQASLIAGTIFQGTQLPLTIWFFGHLPDQPGQDRIVGPGSQATTGCELSHGVADPPQADAGDGGPRKPLCPCRECPGGRCLPRRGTQW